jgi:hypothetical protein
MSDFHPKQSLGSKLRHSKLHSCGLQHEDCRPYAAVRSVSTELQHDKISTNLPKAFRQGRALQPLRYELLAVKGQQALGALSGRGHHKLGRFRLRRANRACGTQNGEGNGN